MSSSNINFSSIDTNYPIAGQDNNSQGFRDNFSAISTAFATAKAEITLLNNNAVVVTNLETGDPAENNLQGSKVFNGITYQLYGMVAKHTPESGTDPVDIDVSTANLHECKLADNAKLTFSGWPDMQDDTYAVVRIHLLSDTNGEYTVTFDEIADNGPVVKETSFPSPFTVPDTGYHKIIEAWTYNNGATVFVKYIGEFDLPPV